jgi:hypothetical protein
MDMVRLKRAEKMELDGLLYVRQVFECENGLEYARVLPYYEDTGEEY